jgi:hypothetical protein
MRTLKPPQISQLTTDLKAHYGQNIAIGSQTVSSSFGGSSPGRQSPQSSSQCC